MCWHIALVAEVAMTDSYIYVITALLPLAALMLVVQVNPYHALVIRGVLGAVAALVYVVMGAADVALTEALVGTMLAITLYAVAVRSSLTLRLGVLEEEQPIEAEKKTHYAQTTRSQFEQLTNHLRTVLSKRYMRLELVPYLSRQALDRALTEKEVHATFTPLRRSADLEQTFAIPEGETEPYQTTTRIQRIYDIFQSELASPAIFLSYVAPPEIELSHPSMASKGLQTETPDVKPAEPQTREVKVPNDSREEH